MEFNFEEASKLLDSSINSNRSEFGYEDTVGYSPSTPNVVKMTESELLAYIGVSELIRENVITLNDCNDFITESILDDANELETTITENSSLDDITTAFTEIQYQLTESNNDFYNEPENSYLITEAIGYALFSVKDSERFISEGIIDKDGLFEALSEQATITERRIKEQQITESFESIKNTIFGALSGVVSDASDSFNSGVNRVSDGFDKVGDRVSDGFDKGVSRVSAGFDKAGDSFNSGARRVNASFSSGINRVSAGFDKVVDSARASASELKADIGKTMDKLDDYYDKASESSKKKLIELARELQTAIESGSEEAVRTVMSAINTLESHTDRAVSIVLKNAQVMYDGDYNMKNVAIVGGAGGTVGLATGLATGLTIGLAKIIGTKSYNMIKSTQQNRTIAKAKAKFGNEVAEKLKQAYKVIGDKKINFRHRKRAGKFLAITISKLKD